MSEGAPIYKWENVQSNGVRGQKWKQPKDPVTIKMFVGLNTLQPPSRTKSSYMQPHNEKYTQKNTLKYM